MKPSRILLFIFSVLALLFVVSVFFPRDGVRLGDDLRLHFLTLDELIRGDTVEYADISGIISQSSALDDTSMLAALNMDRNGHGWPDTLRADEDSLKLRIHPLEYPGNDRTILFPAFRRLQGLKKDNQLIRIMHYGDSQIEGDRMTSYIRNRLQQRFGGSGAGFRPTVELYGYQSALEHTVSDNWIRYTAFGEVDTTLVHNRYGLMASFARFTPYRPDSLPDDTTVHEAWIRLKTSERTYRLKQQFEQSQLFYGYARQPVYFECLADGELFDADILFPEDDLNIKTLFFPRSPRELTFIFRGRASPDFYGFTLDGKNGVAVDNVAMRGSAGLVFTKIDEELFARMLDTLDVSMLILQFGGNVVPYIAEKYDYYERWFYSQLSRLKQIGPDLPIVVIGVHDMSVREKDHYISYPNLEGIRTALKNASFRACCAYWDMYEAMGGYNSMPSWVYAEPPLAATDFTHFNARGARVIAEMFCNALIYDYERYLRGQSKELAKQ